MKKIFFVIFIAQSILSFGQSDLSRRLAADPAFQKLSEISETTTGLLAPLNKAIIFDIKKLEAIDVNYIASEINVSPEVIIRIKDEMKVHGDEIINKYPEISNLQISELLLIIEQSFDILHNANDFNLLMDAKKDVNYIASEINVLPEVIIRIKDEKKVQRDEIIKKYPEISNLQISEVLPTIQQRFDILHSVNNFNLLIDAKKNENPCSGCKRSGRAAMIAALILGGASCPGHIFTIWGCGFAGWWAAAEATLACIRAHCRD